MQSKMVKKLLCGSGSYYQGDGALEQCGPELKRKGLRSAFVIGGVQALAAAGQRLGNSLTEHDVRFEREVFSGHCTAAEVDHCARQAKELGSDCIVGVGGGKALDAAKAASALLRLPVFTVPTCAATCSAWAALSILYDNRGRQAQTRYHPDEVAGVFADTGILAKAPARYLAAGIADAMAKTCEYSSMRRELLPSDVDISKYLGYRIAQVYDETLLTIGAQAYADNCGGLVTSALEDAIFLVIAATGIVSGMGGFAGRVGSRFAIAHGFNEVIRGRYVEASRWLHGEIVAVGILAQLHANGMEEQAVGRVRELYAAMGVPVSLERMGILLDDEAFALFQRQIAEHSHAADEHTGRIFEAVRSVRRSTAQAAVEIKPANTEKRKGWLR